VQPSIQGTSQGKQGFDGAPFDRQILMTAAMMFYQADGRMASARNPHQPDA
jgi:hypothetical protein